MGQIMDFIQNGTKKAPSASPYIARLNLLGGRISGRMPRCRNFRDLVAQFENRKLGARHACLAPLPSGSMIES